MNTPSPFAEAQRLQDEQREGHTPETTAPTMSTQEQQNAAGKMSDKQLGEIGAKAAFSAGNSVGWLMCVHDGMPGQLIGFSAWRGDEPARTAFAAAVREQVEKECMHPMNQVAILNADAVNQQIQKLTQSATKAWEEADRSKSKIAELTNGITDQGEEIDRLTAELAAAEKRLAELQWRPISVKPTREDADEGGFVIVLRADKLTSLVQWDANGFHPDFDWRQTSQALRYTKWRPAALTPAPKAKELERADFENTFPNMPKERTPSGMYANDKFQAMWESWQAARASKEVQR